MLKKCLPLLLLCTAPVFAKPVLTVYTYDSFAADWGPGPVVKKAFEADCNCELKLVALEDGVSLLNRLRMEGKNSKADVVLGLDNNLLDAASKTGLFAKSGVAADAVNVPGGWNNDDVLAAVARVDRLAGSDRGQVAVALVRKDQLRRIQPFDRRSYRRRAPVRRLHPIDIDVVVRQHRAAHRRNADRVVLDLHFVDHFGDQFVDRSVAAPRTEVHHGIGQQPGLRIDPVFRDQFYFRFSHKLLL